ncbi:MULTISPECIES: metallophosphoesterase [unclassified Corynebacterium]|uniref:metallophosphoesterase family protein n=1 Tax=unclassified Corynebacterium TaxID=2624378 RepID=UPI0029CA1F5D|nr:MULTISPECIES: metallophosphoesterase [unclassified Corynebacterium]WPF65289.1 metallophosphoesterase [Corynebacterium sp. 22KM0430]WPF67784.1 metallophosphoesterase [Corynebacterium sp. 21KM1197]
MTAPTLWAVSDLHAAVPANREHVERLRPRNPGDWLIVAGDVAENVDLVIATLGRLRERFPRVIWAPGNHELLSRASDRFRGRARYAELVRRCREIGVHTPEDEYPIFQGTAIAPLCTLYDYSFAPAGITYEGARAAGKMLIDAFALEPFANVPAWCRERLAYSAGRLAALAGMPTVLVNHWPLVREPVQRMGIPELSLWCGTEHTRRWPQRYRARAVVYGHLHLPGVTRVHGVPHIEASLGYPREWRERPELPERPWPYPVLGGHAR